MPVTEQTSSWTSRILRFRRVRQALALSLLAAVSISAAFLLSPSRVTPPIPGDEALGTPFAGTLKANRDYDVLDPETTAEKREEAARSVWPVYDFDAGAAETLQRRISEAFGDARAALNQYRRAHPGKGKKAETDLRNFLIGQRD